MRYKVVLHPSEEGFAVSCPGLPGCWSQGATEEEAVENIQDAIRQYLAAVAESTSTSLVREVEVEAWRVPKVPGVPHLRAVRALQRAGFEIVREGAKHIVMSNGRAFLTIPRHDPVNAYTMAGIVRDAGLTIEEFRELL